MQYEKANATDAIQAAFGMERVVVESAHAEGRYVAHCVGPVEEYRARYVELRDRISMLMSVKPDSADIEALQAELDAIPMESKWDDVIDNIVVNVGKNLALDTLFAGSSYTTVGPYMFLAGGTPASAAATDTMASKTGWTEVGSTNAPAYKYPNSGGTQVRAATSWSAAASGSKALSSNASFYFTSGGTVAGCGIVLGSGAVNTIDSTAGTLYSVGAFSGGSKTVAAGDTLSVSYTASL